jgi:hypothetical protein
MTELTLKRGHAMIACSSTMQTMAWLSHIQKLPLIIQQTFDWEWQLFQRLITSPVPTFCWALGPGWDAIRNKAVIQQYFMLI